MPLDLKTIAAGMAWTAIPEFDSSVVDETAAPYLALKFLEPAQPATFVRCPCGDSHGATVERILTKDRRTVFLAFCEETGIPYPIELDKLRRWRVNMPAILSRIQQGFECSGKQVERGAGLWFLGETGISLAGCRRQVFFAARLSSEVLISLPEGTTQILVVGELNPPDTDKFSGRIFQMCELMSVQDGECVFDLDIVQRRLEAIKPAKGKGVQVIPKNAVQKSREALILDFLDSRAMSLRDGYWNAVNKGEPFDYPRRPTYEQIAEHIKVITNGTQTPNQATVMRTIQASANPKLKLLWENIGDVTFVRDYRRKKKQPRKRRSETDEDFIEEMFSEVGMEQDHDGFHVV